MNNQKLCFFIMFVFLFFIGFSKGAEISNDNYIERIFKPEDEGVISEKLWELQKVMMQYRIINGNSSWCCNHKHDFKKNYETVRGFFNSGTQGVNFIEYFKFSFKEHIKKTVQNIKNVLGDKVFLNDIVNIKKEMDPSDEKIMIRNALDTILTRESKLLEEANKVTCLDEKVPEFEYDLLKDRKSYFFYLLQFFFDIFRFFFKFTPRSEVYQKKYDDWLQNSMKRKNLIIFQYFILSRLSFLNLDNNEDFKQELKLLIQSFLQKSDINLKSYNKESDRKDGDRLPMHILHVQEGNKNYIFVGIPNEEMKRSGKFTHQNKEGFLLITVCSAVKAKIKKSKNTSRNELNQEIETNVDFILKNLYSLFFDESFTSVLPQLRGILTEFYHSEGTEVEKDFYLTDSLKKINSAFKIYSDKEEINSNDKSTLLDKLNNIFNDFASNYYMTDFVDLESKINDLAIKYNISKQYTFEIKKLFKIIERLLIENAFNKYNKKIGENILNIIELYFIRFYCSCFYYCNSEFEYPTEHEFSIAYSVVKESDPVAVINKLLDPHYIHILELSVDLQNLNLQCILGDIVDILNKDKGNYETMEKCLSSKYNELKNSVKRDVHNIIDIINNGKFVDFYNRLDIFELIFYEKILCNILNSELISLDESEKVDLLLKIKNDTIEKIKNALQTKKLQKKEITNLEIREKDLEKEITNLEIREKDLEKEITNLEIS